MININVTPEQVNQFVTDALMKSTIGTAITSAIDKAVNEALNGYNSPVAKLVQEQIKISISEILKKDQYKEMISGKVASICTDDFLNKVISNSVQKVLKEIEDSRY